MLAKILDILGAAFFTSFTMLFMFSAMILGLMFTLINAFFGQKEQDAKDNIFDVKPTHVWYEN